MKKITRMLALGTVATLIAGMLPKGTAQAAITTAKEFNGHYYQVITDAKTFQQAEIQSEVIGAHLVTITSEEEQQFVHSLSGTDDVWLGAVYQNGAWKWVTGESFSYTNWMKGQPSDPENAPYAQFWKGKGEWDDAWDHENAYVMEWESEADYREKKQKLLNLRLYNGHSYKYIPMEMTWMEAKTYCEKLGGHLVTVTSKGESQFVYNMIDHSKDTWIGLYAKKIGCYAWVTKERTDYLNFGEEVNADYNGTEKYFGFYDTKYGYGNKWNDFRNDNNMPFVCEWDNGSKVILTNVKSIITVKKGSSKSLKYQVFPAKQKVTFKTSNKKVATVSKKGVVKGIRKGTVNIAIKAGKKRITVKVKVK